MAEALSAVHAEFIGRGVSVIVASRNARLVPSVSRGVACRVSPDRRRVSVILRESQCGALLDDLRRCGDIAACFSQPTSHRTIQLKGRDARIGPVEDTDAELAAHFCEDFSAELESLGFPREFTRALLGFSPGELLAVSFSPIEAYSQTPGPRAGEPLR